MGRYYYGDIDGKFAFAIQSSFAADRFGQTAVNDPYENEDGDEYDEYTYYFTSDDIPDVREELANILTKIGPYYSQLKMATMDFDTTLSQHLADYYDYELGLQILDCLERTGSCTFGVEA